MTDWDKYSRDFQAEMARPDQAVTWKIAPGDYTLIDGVLTRRRPIKPLQAHQRLLLETILRLAPKSVLELGSGGGDNLWNLQVLAPKVKAHGVDVSEAQIAFTKQRSPDLKAKLYTMDAGGQALLEVVPVVDLVFSNVSLMHIDDRGTYKSALLNAFIKAHKWVVLMENWSNWPFMIDIQGLITEGIQTWPEAHYYYRWSPEYARPHLLVVAHDPITQDGFLPLVDYETLLAPVRKDPYNIEAEKCKSKGEPVALE